MKKYACNRLYLSSNEYLSPSVVCLDDEGCVISFALLKDELDATEWIGGVVILSEVKDITFEQNFHQLLQKSSASPNALLYAWHISNFDFNKEEFSSISTLKRLI